jgi:hypothetical protein
MESEPTRTPVAGHGDADFEDDLFGAPNPEADLAGDNDVINVLRRILERLIVSCTSVYIMFLYDYVIM